MSSRMDDGNEMACRELVQLVTDFLEDQLTEVDRRRFEEHLAICSDCGTIVDQFRATITAVAGIGAPSEVPGATREDLLAAFRRWTGTPT